MIIMATVEAAVEFEFLLIPTVRVVSTTPRFSAFSAAFRASLAASSVSFAA